MEDFEMTKIYLILFFLCINSLSIKNDTLKKLIKNFDEFKRPVIHEIFTEKKGEIIKFSYASKIIKIYSYQLEPAKLVIVQNNKNIFENNLNYAIWGHYFEKVISFDADKNGFDDIFIISTPVGASGDGANIRHITALFFYADSDIKCFELSSFFGAENLFGDFNGDGKIEFACVKLIRDNKYKYYSINLFSFEKGNIINTSNASELFPIYAEENGYITIIKSLPSSIEEESFFNYPNVLIKSVQKKR